ncbi:NlpC/P60 family protein [Alloalcanivorax sp. C16-2]|uniref:NlpC/P60 family protein n=1 Tax=Alloalcanivorax sp. C16-2 TaxID=3390052 RepID=UPI003970DA50
MKAPGGGAGLGLLVLIALLAGCASRPMPAVESRDAGGEPPPLLRDDVPVGDTASPVLPLLREQADAWRGVPYRLGGTDRRGVDCSAFVQITFQSRLGVEVPRTTEQLAREGRRVPRDDLAPGDLVFFKTGFRQRHVGIYMGGDRFLHASTSRGVMTSSLNNVYWRRHYWKARRLDLTEPPSAVSLSDESR